MQLYNRKYTTIDKEKNTSKKKKKLNKADIGSHAKKNFRSKKEARIKQMKKIIKLMKEKKQEKTIKK